MRSRQSDQNKAASGPNKAISDSEDEDLMCFDGKTGGFALLKWDLLGIEMTRQHFRLFSSLELDSHKI